MTKPFWQRKRLAEMTAMEWESLCDGCGKCCLLKLEDEEDGTVYYTDVHCRLLDAGLCRCGDYTNRAERVPGCMVMGPEKLDALWMMPESCAYRRLAEGRGLPDWHHLVCGDRSRVIADGHSVAGRVVDEASVSEDDLEDHVVDWPVLENQE